MSLAVLKNAPEPAAPRPAPATRPNAADRRRDLSLAIEFQPDMVEVEEAPPSRYAAIVLYTMVGLLVCAVAWATFATLDQVVSAPGKLSPHSPNLVVQPFEASLIREVKVRPGDVVKAGDTLVVLDPTFAAADLAELAAKEGSLRSAIARLEAELAGADLPPVADAGADALLQQTLFERRRAAYRAQVDSFDQEVRRQEAQVASSTADIKALTERLAVVSRIEGMRQELTKQEVGSRLNLLLATNDRLEIAGSLERARNAKAEAEHALAGTMAKRESFVQEWRQKVAEELVSHRREAAALAEQIRKANLRSDRITLTAPQDAVVLDVKGATIGAVVSQGDALVTLVPVTDTLEIEAKVPASDVGFLTQGQDVRVKFHAFPFQKHGTAEGRLKWVSEDVFTDPENPQAPYYRTRIELTKTDLRNTPSSFRLMPGMTVTAEIEVGDRSILSYLLYPITGALDEAMSEPR